MANGGASSSSSKRSATLSSFSLLIPYQVFCPFTYIYTYIYIYIPFEWICRVCTVYIHRFYFSHYLQSFSPLYFSLFSFSLPLSLSLFLSLSPSLSFLLSLHISLIVCFFLCFYGNKRCMFWPINLELNFFYFIKIIKIITKFSTRVHRND